MDAEKIACTGCKEANPPHLLRAGKCPGCILDSYIPKGYQDREVYVFIQAFGHANAVFHPKTGVPILDTPSGMRYVDHLGPRNARSSPH